LCILPKNSLRAKLVLLNLLQNGQSLYFIEMQQGYVFTIFFNYMPYLAFLAIVKLGALSHESNAVSSYSTS